MEVTYYGHSCFQVVIAGKKLLFDPFITPNELAKGIDINNIKVDFILLSHGHQDHVADVETVYRNSKAQIVSTFEVVSWFSEKGLENGHAMNHGGSWDFDFGRVKMVNAVHSSSMPDGSYGGNPAGFVIQSGEDTFYYSGDTALHFDMKLLEEEFNIDFAFLPIGSNFTMGVEDANRAADFIGTKKVIGMHYDTFPPIKIDHEKAVATFKEHDRELILMGIGETINL
ncbi:metal-dependent hydrolase [Fulvivirga imtechensis]|uniref:metal-dependent hydrolase n=1 Tax=Fulvivirga imtechensis TaxID=881893 RepID=UPI00058FC034|nr:metal-dependent hydrolase [Fulvivirga imtechensis]